MEVGNYCCFGVANVLCPIEAFDSSFSIGLIEVATRFSWKFPYTFPAPVRTSFLKLLGINETIRYWRGAKSRMEEALSVRTLYASAICSAVHLVNADRLIGRR